MHPSIVDKKQRLTIVALDPLDVARIIALKSHPQSFEQLVLPLEHKSIVQGLVETHSRPEKTEDMDNAYREDLVRGKGKGVILLLHGVPGVGKTSTAECVAEKTKRPLFALTCGMSKIAHGNRLAN